MTEDTNDTIPPAAAQPPPLPDNTEEELEGLEELDAEDEEFTHEDMAGAWEAGRQWQKQQGEALAAAALGQALGASIGPLRSLEFSAITERTTIEISVRHTPELPRKRGQAA